jgi:ATP-dependent DNA ligase
MRKMPGDGRLAFIPAMMPTVVDKPPKGEGWTHEVKFDGYRTQLIIDPKGARFFTRRGFDWTAKYRTAGRKRSSTLSIRPDLRGWFRSAETANIAAVLLRAG